MTLAKRMRWWPEKWPYWVPDRWRYLLSCLMFGHEPIPDQCNIPSHDYCAWCQKSMPRFGNEEAV